MGYLEVKPFCIPESEQWVKERERVVFIFQACSCGEVEADTLWVNMISTTLSQSMSRSFVAFEREWNSCCGQFFCLYLQGQMGKTLFFLPFFNTKFCYLKVI